MTYWKDPFQSWNYIIEEIRLKETDFHGLTSDSLCPCGSGKSMESVVKTTH